MNLQTNIKPELWKAIESTYQNENYTHSIVDAMHYLSDFIRERTGVDGDGASLVGQALGGDSPRLRVNKLQTDTERNEQRGLESILRGMYWAIRNPRSHEQIVDSKETADAVIYFLNYLLAILDKSEEPFTVDKFMLRVFDQAFVESPRYAELLVDDIPEGKLTDTVIQLYRSRTNGNGSKLKFVFEALYTRLSEDQIAQFISVVSDDLKTTQSETDIRLSLQILRTEFWPKLKELTRLRIENMLIQSMKNGDCLPNGRTRRGSLGTWAQGYFEYFSIRNDAGGVLLGKLQSNEQEQRRYVAKFFLSELPTLLVNRYQMAKCVQAVSEAIREGDREMREQLVNCLYSYPTDWQQAFVESLKDLTDPDNPLVYLVDGTPFLSSEVSFIEETSITTDDDEPPF